MHNKVPTEPNLGQVMLPDNPRQPQDGQQRSRADKADGSPRRLLHPVLGQPRQGHKPDNGKADYRQRSWRTWPAQTAGRD